MPVLLLRLAAPLQSWGVESKFDTRRTLGYPTKSGVIGLVASAMGRERTEPLDDLNELKIGIRVENEGRQIRDYHTANGEKTKKYITHRFYLSDATFLVGLEHEDAGLIEKIEDALKHPAFPLFLGRRSCPRLHLRLYGDCVTEIFLMCLNRKVRCLTNSREKTPTQGSELSQKAKTVLQ